MHLGPGRQFRFWFQRCSHSLAELPNDGPAVYVVDVDVDAVVHSGAFGKKQRRRQADIIECALPRNRSGRGWRFSMKLETAAFGYPRETLVLEPRVINLGLSATCAVLISANDGLMLL